MVMDLQKKIYNFILDYWKLIKAYTPKPDINDTKTWDELVAEAEKMLKKYDDGSKEYKFFKALVFTWFDYMGKGNYQKHWESEE